MSDLDGSLPAAAAGTCHNTISLSLSFYVLLRFRFVDTIYVDRFRFFILFLKIDLMLSLCVALNPEDRADLVNALKVSDAFSIPLLCCTKIYCLNLVKDLSMFGYCSWRLIWLMLAE